MPKTDWQNINHQSAAAIAEGSRTYSNGKNKDPLEDDDISLPDTPGTSTSTPTPPTEYFTKLEEAEAMIARLKRENISQKQEVSTNLQVSQLSIAT